MIVVVAAKLGYLVMDYDAVQLPFRTLEDVELLWEDDRELWQAERALHLANRELAASTAVLRWHENQVAKLERQARVAIVKMVFWIVVAVAMLVSATWWLVVSVWSMF